MAEQRRNGGLAMARGYSKGARTGGLRRLLARRPIRLLLLATWALLLSLALLVACRATPATADLHTQVILARAYLAEGDGQVVFRVEVNLRNADEQPVGDLQVRAEVFDANGQSMANVKCDPLPQQAGAYHSAAFSPTTDASGFWQVKVSVGKGSDITESWWNFQVDNSDMAQATSDQKQEIAGSRAAKPPRTASTSTQ